MRDEDRTMTTRTPADRHRTLRRLGALAGVSVALGACTNTGEVVTASVPNDYRQRHPIAIQEADRSVVIFVGHARGGLSASQRADVIGLAQVWLREGTGAINADVPVDTPNARAAADSFREIQSLLAAAGVPPRGITVRRYHPEDPRQLAAIRLNYPKISAIAGPCGLRTSDPRSRTRATAKTNPTTISAAPISATWRRWSTIRRTSCSRGLKRPPIRRNARPLSRSIARAPRPRSSIPIPTRPNSAIQANDQLRAKKSRRPAGRHFTGRGRSHRPGATRVRAGFLRDGGNRCGRAIGGRRPPPRQGPSEDPDGGHGSRHRGLSNRAYSQRDHPGDRRPQRYPDRPRSARHRVRFRIPRPRNRPRQRRHALSRAGAPRRQRLRDRAGQHHRRGAFGLRPVLGAGG